MDALYGLEPAEFTRARDKHAAELRKEGAREDAAAVKSLRKPSAPAWALNQLARRNARDVERLVAAGEQLRAAQEKLLAGGGRAPLDKASREERELVSRLTREALALARKAGIATSAALEEKIAATLRSAALDENAAGELRAGRLVRELEAVGLFGAASEPGVGAAPPTGAAAGKGKKAAPRKGAAAADNRRELEQALKDARSEARRAKHELDAAAKAVRGAEEKAGGAARRAEDASRRAKEASEKAGAAAHRLDEARGRERDAAEAHDRAEAAVARAESRLRD